jgi:hypothetical protein
MVAEATESICQSAQRRYPQADKSKRFFLVAFRSLFGTNHILQFEVPIMSDGNGNSWETEDSSQL